MKPKFSRSVVFSLGAFAASFLGSQHLGATIIWKAGNDDNLNQITSWWTGEAGTTNPGSIGTSDTLRFGGSGQGASRTLALGGNLAVGALRLDNQTGAPNYNVTINSGNTLTLNGNNDYTAGNAQGIVLNSGTGGTLTINADIVVGASQQWVTSRGLTIGGNVDLGSGIARTLTVNTATTTLPLITGIISGTTGNFTKSGNGTLYLNQVANSFGGVVTVAGGSLKVAKLAIGTSNSSIGSGSSAIVLNGGTLDYVGTTTDTTDRAIDMRAGAAISNNGAGGQITFTAANVIQGGPASARTLTLGGTNTNANTFGSVIGNSGTVANITTLAKSGVGTWVLTGANTYTGSTTISQGILRVTGSGVLGGAAGSTTDVSNIWFTSGNAGATLEFETSANLGAAGQLRFRNTSGTPGTGGDLNYIGTTAQVVSKAIQCDTGVGVRLSSDSVGGSVDFSGSWAASSSARPVYLGGTGTGANTISGAIIGSTLTKVDAGTWTLSGANTYIGATTVSAGTLKAGVASVAGVSGAFGNNSALSLANAVDANIDLNGFNTQIGSLTGGGALGGNVILGANTLTIGGNNSSPAAYAGIISGVGGAVTKSGNGILTLSGASTYTGATTISAGTLSVTGSQTGSAVSVTSAATLGGTGSVGVTTVASGGLLAPGVGGTGKLTTDNLIFSGIGTITLGDFTNYTAAPAIAAAGLTANGAASSVTFNLGGTTATNGTYQLLSYTGGSIGGTGAAAFVLGTKPSTGARQSQSLEDTGSALNWVVMGANAVWTGVTSSEWSTNAITASKNWKLDTDSSITDYITGDIALFNDSANDAAPIVNISVADVTPASMAFSNATKDYTINGSFGIAAGALTKSGAGGLVINTANSFASGTTLTDGTITLGTATALGSGSIALNGGSLAINGQTIANAVVAGGGAVVGTGTIGGNITGTTLNYSTSGGTLTLIGTNTAAASIGALATLQVGSGNTTGTIGNVANSGSLVFNRSNGSTYSSVISGTGSVRKTGDGTLALSTQQSYSGGTTVETGILDLTGGGGMGGAIRGTVTVNSGATLRLSTGDATGYAGGANALTTINLAGGTLNVNTTSNQTLGSSVINMTGGSITGVGTSNLDFFGNGSALNTFASATESTISLPTMNLRQDNTAFDIADGAAVNDLVISSNIGNGSIGNHAMIKKGLGKMTLSGTNSYNGSTTISAGILQLGNGSTTGKLSTSSTITNNANLTIHRSNAVAQGTDFSAAAITGTGSLTAAGTGTIALSAANSYSGGTSVNAGADLRINGIQTGAGAVDVAATGKLGGSGSVIGGINVSGVLAPGNSIESLGGGSLSFTNGSTYAYELQTDLYAGTPSVAADLTYSSGTLSIASGTTLTLTDLATSVALVNGSKLTLISSVGAWNGGLFSYLGNTLADNSTFTLGVNEWRFDYDDTIGGSNYASDQAGAANFVTMTVIPEPNVAALIGGFGALALLRRRRA
jgi:autotransporter-associated beta strand protein